MRDVKRRRTIIPLRSNTNGNNIGTLAFFYLKYFLVIGFLIIFLIRVIGVINSHKETGRYTYVKMLNVGMPIVKAHVYEEDDYKKNNLSIKGILSEALGLPNINLLGIIGNEISYFSGAKIDTTEISDHSKGFDKFKVNENTIAKLTPEEIAELNDVSKAYKPSLKKTLDSSKPEIFIYHTHTMEHYAESEEGQTENKDVNVVGVGEILTKELEEGYGISVVHDKTNYTLPDYPTAYDRSRDGLKKYLSEFGDFKLTIDLHRDGVDNKELVTTNLNGQSLAKFLFVTSENVPTYEVNKKTIDELYNIGKNLFQELIKETRPFEYGINGFNQDLTENSMLLEIGAHTNTAQEAKLTAKYIARIIAEYLNG